MAERVVDTAEAKLLKEKEAKLKREAEDKLKASEASEEMSESQPKEEK